MIWVGLPAYNESHRIASLLADIDRALKRGGVGYKVVVYDDGSSDDTIAKVNFSRKVGVNVDIVEGRENKGLGHALSYLLNHCADATSPEDIVIIMDADATHNPEHIHRMISYVKDGFDLVVASRYTPYSRIKGLKLYRRFLSYMANFVLKMLFPIKGITDYSCAYRAYTAKILKLAKAVYKVKLVEECSFACMAEFLIKLKKLDIIACEIPLILRYDKKTGPTKMNVPDTAIRTLKVVFKSFFLPRIDKNVLEKLKEEYNI